MFAAYRELELPLRDEAIDRSFEDLLRRTATAAVTPEAASVSLWSLADAQYNAFDREYLEAFKNLAISLTLFEDPDCDLDLELDEWRAEMLALARAALDGISLDQHDERALWEVTAMGLDFMLAAIAWPDHQAPWTTSGLLNAIGAHVLEDICLIKSTVGDLS